MMERPTEEDAQAHLETWIIAPSGNYRDTLSWLAVLSKTDYPLYLDQVATLAEVQHQALDKEVQQRRRLLDGTLTPGGSASVPSLSPVPYGQAQQVAYAPAQPQWPSSSPGYAQPGTAPAFVPVPSTALVPVATAPLAVYTCRSCGNAAPPMSRTRVTTSGWIVFAILFLSCTVLSFIPILSMRESFPACGRCRRQLT